MDPRTQQLLDRTFHFGVSLLKFLRKLPDDYIYRIPKVQACRSCISIGANYEESQGAVSRRDFANKIGISYKEARETSYWLRILSELYPEEKYRKDLNTFLKESNELKSIFASIKKTAQRSIP